MLRRKRMPEDLEPAWTVFLEQAERVETARQALLRCLPVGRVDPAPVPVGLDLLRDELEAVAAEMPCWKVDAMAEQWVACESAVAEALDRIEPARVVAEESQELEHVLVSVSKIVSALDAWREAERGWLSLRTRS